MWQCVRRRQAGVQYVMLGELLICIYNLILHQVTFDAGAQAAEGAGGSVHDSTVRIFF